MSDITFIIANKKSTSNISGVKYFTDCTVSIDHNFRNTITSYPIEEGANVSDHTTTNNNVFTVSGVFTPYSFNRYPEDTLSYDDRVNDAYQFLMKLRNNREVFTLVSKYDVYPDCVVSNLSIPVTPDDGGTLIFEMEITQIRRAKVESVGIILLDKTKEEYKDSAANMKNKGNKSPSFLISAGRTLFGDTEEEKELLDNIGIQKSGG